MYNLSNLYLTAILGILILGAYFTYNNSLIEGLTEKQYNKRQKSDCRENGNQEYKKEITAGCTLSKNTKYPYCDTRTYDILSNKNNNYPKSNVLDWIKHCYNPEVAELPLLDKNKKQITTAQKFPKTNSQPIPLKCETVNGQEYPKCTTYGELNSGLSIETDTKLGGYSPKMKYFSPYVKEPTDNKVGENEICCGGWDVLKLDMPECSEGTKFDKEKRRCVPSSEKNKSPIKGFSNDNARTFGGGTFKTQSKCNNYNYAGTDTSMEKIEEDCNKDNDCEYVNMPGVNGHLSTIGCQPKTMVKFFKEHLKEKKKDNIKGGTISTKYADNAGNPSMTDRDIELQKKINSNKIISGQMTTDANGVKNTVSKYTGNNDIAEELRILLNPWLQSTLQQLQPKTYHDLIEKANVSLQQKLLEGVFLNDPDAPQPANGWGSCLQDNPSQDGTITIIGRGPENKSN